MTINEMRAKRANAWDEAKKFLDTHTNSDGTMSAEDAATYDRMENDITSLTNNIQRMERAEEAARSMNDAVNKAHTTKPGEGAQDETGRASKAYNASFWTYARNRAVSNDVLNALQVGTDSEGGYLVPDEFDRNLIEALEEENVMRRIAHVIRTNSGDRKIPVVASRGTASWVDEEAAIPESDNTFGQKTLSAYKLASMTKVSEELLQDSEAYAAAGAANYVDLGIGLLALTVCVTLCQSLSAPAPVSVEESASPEEDSKPSEPDFF